MEEYKCLKCGTLSKYHICDKCWADIEDFRKLIEGTRKNVILFIMQDEDVIKVYNKCKGKTRRKQLKIIRNYFNRCGYMSNVKNKLGKYYRIKI